ncbi:hypothetical protein CPC08DRAFT_775024 [Agrocybe pediades]|nr:hypothetical protein CPC08DRAFT_775024 [Agrocybe pediades]
MAYLYLGISTEQGYETGYEYSFILAQKERVDGPTEQGAAPYDCEWVVHYSGDEPTPWTVQARKIDQFSSTRLFARVLLRAFAPTNRLRVENKLSSLLAQVPIVDYRGYDTSVYWALRALEILTEKQIIQPQFPIMRAPKGRPSVASKLCELREMAVGLNSYSIYPQSLGCCTDKGMFRNIPSGEEFYLPTHYSTRHPRELDRH